MKENKRSSNRNVVKNEEKKQFTNVNEISLKDKIKRTWLEYKKFYKENLKFKHTVLTIIMIILFFVLTKIQLENVESFSNVQKASFFDTVLKNEIPVNFMMILAGISPYLYISILGVLTISDLIFDLVVSYALNKSIFTIIICSIGAIIKIFSYALCIATGIYYCGISTKRFKYSQVSFFGYTDFKKSLYQIRKNNKKIEEMDKLKQEKIKKRESYNVKVPYKMFAISYVISVIISIVGTIFLR